MSATCTWNYTFLWHEQMNAVHCKLCVAASRYKKRLHCVVHCMNSSSAWTETNCVITWWGRWCKLIGRCITVKSVLGEKTLVFAKTIYHRWWSRNVSVEYWAWSQWLRNVRRGSAAARLLGLRVRIPLGAWMSVMLVCCQVEVSMSGSSLFQRGPT